MRASQNIAFRSGFCALLLRTDESARVYAPAERCYSYGYYFYYKVLESCFEGLLIACCSSELTS